MQWEERMTDKKKGRREERKEGEKDGSYRDREREDGIERRWEMEETKRKGMGVISLFARKCRAGDSERQQKPLVIIILNKEGDPVGPRTLRRAAHPRLVF